MCDKVCTVRGSNNELQITAGQPPNQLQRWDMARKGKQQRVRCNTGYTSQLVVTLRVVVVGLRTPRCLFRPTYLAVLVDKAATLVLGLAPDDDVIMRS